MEMFSLPEEVFYHNILPKLGWNDLLRFRRISKYSKFVAGEYLKNHPELAPEIEINETDKTMDKFMEMGIPTRKIFLNNESSGDDFFETNAESIVRFLEHYGPGITDLRLRLVSIRIEGLEEDFFDKLPNLKNLEGNVYYSLTDDETEELYMRVEEERKKEDQEYQSGKQYYPNVFKSLRRLSVSMETEDAIPGISAGYSKHVSKFCENLEYACLPFSSYVPALEQKGFPRANPESQTQALASVMLELNSMFISEQSNLKFYDFKHHYNEFPSKLDFIRREDGIASRAFIDLCKTCVLRGIRLLNVNSAWFKSLTAMEGGQDFGTCVESLINISPMLLMVELPNLTKVEVTTSRSNVPINARCTDWPALQVLKILVDSGSLDHGGMDWVFEGPLAGLIPHHLTPALYRYLFSGVTHPQLVELSLVFKPDLSCCAKCAPKVEDIVSACPNLKKIALGNWAGTNKAICKLWMGLPGLEEISLDSCAKLGNVAFVGENAEKPVFFELARLKKLSLKGLDQMPKVTDTLFKLVIQHVSLTHLTLSSCGPIQNVTIVGIRALLGGRFAGSIEKFSFDNWSLADCSEEEFISLESQFRSHDMI